MVTEKPAKLVLEDGKEFPGYTSLNQEKMTFGEAVFTTGMVGYPEALTDPSYTGQLLCFTYPLIGNYGVPKKETWQSDRIRVSGMVIDQLADTWSHEFGEQSLQNWLENENIPYIYGIDTRALTLHLRKSGTMPAAIVTDKTLPHQFPDTLKKNLVSKASITNTIHYGKTGKRIIAVDYGMKESIVRSLLNENVIISRVPFDYDYSNEEFDGLFLSNGPGDPETCQVAVTILQKAMRLEKPIFGICLGSQLLGLAAGASTYKLPYGHRGHNQPCKELSTGRCFMTSQNHGFAIDEKSLPKGWKVTFSNLNDGSVEGIAHESLPFMGVQFHPEASPGPTDTQHLFTEFLELL